MRQVAGVVVLLAAIAASGCGSSVVAGNGGNTGNGGNGGGASPCPAAEPSAGNVSCAGVPGGFRCTYGDEVRPECRHDWTCSGGTWVTTKSICIEPSPGTCPGAEPPAGQACIGMDGAVCTFGDDICLCTACGAGPCMQNAAWICAKPPAGSGCPAVVPNDGSPCSTPGADCTYGIPCGGAGTHVTCTNGTWLWDQAIACPD